MARQTDLLTLWRNIVQAGSTDAYIQAQLQERGYLVERRETTDGMSERELADYKKSLRTEAEERKKVKKEVWQAYRATHIVFLGDGIYWNDEATKDKWDLAHAEERAAENELPPLDTPQQLAEALGLSVTQLRWLAYHREAAKRIHYYRFTIPKRGGGLRPIWAPMKKLKQAQRWILRHIVEHLPVHGSAHGFLPGRSIVSNAAVHTGSALVVKMDVKEFFPTVTYPRVRGVFRKAGYREQIATLLALLCTEAPREIVQHEGKTFYVALGPRCLPQGAPTSPGLTNTLCLRLDQRLTGLAKKLGWRYSRYADDLTFSLPRGHTGAPRLGALLGGARRIVEAEGFQVHPEKTHVARAGARQKVTGLVVNGAAETATLGPRVPRKLRRQLRAAVHNRKLGRPRKDGESDARLLGHAAYVHMTDPKLGGRLFEALK
jgi:retron-type reverse transcriptase